MSENEEMKWRLSTETGPEEDKASSSSSSSSEEQQEKEALQERVQAKAEDIAGGGEASLLTKPEEEVHITGKQYQSITKEKKTKKPSKAKVLTKKKESNNANLTGISKQLKKQSNQLVKIEKVLQPLQKSFNKIDRQSITIKQLYSVVIQLQREIGRQKKQQQQATQKKQERKER
jgi:hypothetical protein